MQGAWYDLSIRASSPAQQHWLVAIDKEASYFLRRNFIMTRRNEIFATVFLEKIIFLTIFIYLFDDGCGGEQKLSGRRGKWNHMWHIGSSRTKSLCCEKAGFRDFCKAVTIVTSLSLIFRTSPASSLICQYTTISNLFSSQWLLTEEVCCVFCCWCFYTRNGLILRYFDYRAVKTKSGEKCVCFFYWKI